MVYKIWIGGVVEDVVDGIDNIFGSIFFVAFFLVSGAA